MPFKIVRNDITKIKADVIVNTANEAPIYSDGVDAAIYHAAGAEALLAERKQIGWMKEGDVAITPGFNLPAKYIIHAVSPCYRGGFISEDKKLRRCYRKSMELAYEYGCQSIAFPLISTGGFGYPKEEGMRIALDEIKEFLTKHEMLIYVVVFDALSTEIGRKQYPKLEEYIDQNYVDNKISVEYRAERFEKHSKTSGNKRNIPFMPMMMGVVSAEQEDCENIEDISVENDRLEAPMLSDSFNLADDYESFLEEKESALAERMKHLSDTFQQYLMFLIKQKGLTPAEVYKRAIITKQLFSKIKLNPNYHPDKATAMRLCVGAQLNLDETKDLLGRAGYALSPCDKRDIIFSFFIENKVYDMIEIDITLEEHNLPCFIE